jgi:acetylglutamate kinase
LPKPKACYERAAIVKLLAKLGGTLLDAADSRDRLAAQIAAARATGAEIVVVHGGGKQMTRFLAERGIESRFVNGLRVTTPETLDAVLKVFAGSVNHELVASLNRAGALAVGLSGIDSFLAEAEQMDPALGAVGRVTRSNPALLHLLTANGYLPVVACVAGDRQGQVYNVNADQMAVACAVAFGAQQLVFLTDVPGVLDGTKQVRPVLSAEQSRRLIADGSVTGGMQAKLEAALAALAGGVPQVRIAPGAVEGVLERILAGEEIGTRMVQIEVAREVNLA